MIFKAGCDVSGGGQDEFCWTIGHVEAEIVIVDMVKARGGRRGSLNLDATVAECAVDLRAYGLVEVLGDKYGGQWPVQSFARHGVVYRISPQPKGDLYAALLPLLTARRVQLPPDREAVRQLKLLRRRAGAQGRDIIDHPGGGTHDDRANAIALCVSQLAGAAVTITPEMFWSSGRRATAPERLFQIFDRDEGLPAVADIDADRKSGPTPWDPGTWD